MVTSEHVITGLVTIIVAAIVGLPATLIALATLRNSKATGTAVRTVDSKTDTVIHQNNEIKTLTDGNLSRITSELSTANARIEGLERLVSSLTPSPTTVIADRRS